MNGPHLVLDHVARFVQLNSDEQLFFLSLLEEHTIQKRKYLLEIGQVCRYDYFVKKGCLKVCYIDQRGVECIIKFAVEDFWVVDIDGFLHAKPSFYYIQAVENTELLRLSKPDYDRLHAQVPKFQEFSKQRWLSGFVALQQRIIQGHSQTAEERYHHFKAKYPNLEQRISLKLIAAYLGITPQFLSVLRKKWATSFS